MDQLEITVYARAWSLPCWRAKRLLRRKVYAFRGHKVPRAYGGARSAGAGAVQAKAAVTGAPTTIGSR